MHKPTSRMMATVAALAVATTAAGVGLSGAALTTQTGVTASVGAGTLDLRSTAEGGDVVLAATGLRPGDERSGELALTSPAGAAQSLSFAVEGPAADQPASPPLSGVLRLALERCDAPGAGCPGATTLLDGTQSLAALSTAPPLALGSLARGGSATYRVTLSWPASATDRDLQAASTAVTLAFDARSGS